MSGSLGCLLLGCGAGGPGQSAAVPLAATRGQRRPAAWALSRLWVEVRRRAGVSGPPLAPLELRDHPVPCSRTSQHRESLVTLSQAPRPPPCRSRASPAWDQHLQLAPSPGEGGGGGKRWPRDLGGAGHLHPQAHPGPGAARWPERRRGTGAKAQDWGWAACAPTSEAESCFWNVPPPLPQQRRVPPAPHSPHPGAHLGLRGVDSGPCCTF